MSILLHVELAVSWMILILFLSFCIMVHFHVAARVITDRDTGKSRGFGFVNFSSSDDAKEAVSRMDGQVSETSFLVVRMKLIVVSGMPK